MVFCLRTGKLVVVWSRFPFRIGIYIRSCFADIGGSMCFVLLGLVYGVSFSRFHLL